MPWTFYLNVTNATDRDLVVKGSHLNWGYWYRDDVDNRGPAIIPKGQSIQAFGIRAARGTATGYEGSCTWGDDAPLGEKSYGTVSLYIDVPYSKSNKSRCTGSGGLFVHGWEGLPGSGHNFVRSITIATKARLMSVMAAVPSTLVAASMESMASMAEAPEDEDDKRYKEHLSAIARKNPDVRDWSAVEKMLPEKDVFRVEELLPQELQMPPVDVLIGRSAPDDIPEHLWRGVGDPDYPNSYAKDLFARSYFCAAVYSLNTDPRAVITLPRGQEKTFKERVEVQSFIHNIHETTWSIKTSLEAKSEDVLCMKEIAAKIETEYGVKSVFEESTTRVTESVEEETFKAPPDHDIVIVPWVFSTMILIYRVDKEDNVQLVAASEWAQWQLCRTYEIS